MNLTGFHRRASGQRGFSVVELLIALIIIVLVCLMLVGYLKNTATTRAAKNMKAAALAKQLETGSLSYYTEYGVYPVPPNVTQDYVLTDTDGAIHATGGSWGPLVECLSGMTKPSTGEASHETIFDNRHSIAFLSLKSTDVESNGPHQDAPLNPAPPNSTQRYFNIAFDADNDGLLGDPKSTSAGLLPSFDSETPGSPHPMTAATRDGVAVWINCSPNGSTQNSSSWIHTY